MDVFEVLRDHATSALVSDALDEAHLRQQWLGHDINPIGLESRLVGRAFTAVATPVNQTPPVRYEGLLKALDAVGQARSSSWRPAGPITRRPGANSYPTPAVPGERSARSPTLVRDKARVRLLGYPVFARSSTPCDIHGWLEVAAVGEDVVIDGVAIHPGDVVVADEDGVVVVPVATLEHVAETLLAKAQEAREMVSGSPRWPLAVAVVPALLTAACGGGPDRSPIATRPRACTTSRRNCAGCGLSQRRSARILAVSADAWSARLLGVPVASPRLATTRAPVPALALRRVHDPSRARRPLRIPCQP